MATGTDRPHVTNAAKSFTVADLLSLPTDVPSGTVDYELDNGRLLTMVPLGDVHGSIQANIVIELKVQGERTEGNPHWICGPCWYPFHDVSEWPII